MDLLSRLSGNSKPLSIEPREIFMSLPQRAKGYEYPRDVQSEVWRKWFDVRDEKNCIIKMNTGSGKTVVGLLILQSCLNEGKGPAVYAVPNKYLVEQVCNEAKMLGIRTSTDRDNYLYNENKAILVTTIHAIVNGRSVFGMNPSPIYPIGSIIIDDVHACLDTISEQFSVKIPDNHELYKEIIQLFAEQWRAYNIKSYTNIVENKDPTKQFLVPFWIWQEKQDKIYQLLSKYNTDDDINHCIFFKLPLIDDSLVTSDCIITARGIDIIPEGVNISKIKSFENADRRIFMSATLSDDSVFVSSIGLRKEDIKRIITPESANDIGDRLILFPRHLNSQIKNDEIKEKVLSIAKEYNVIVIVPSFDRAKYWNPDCSRVIKNETINSFVSALRKNRVGLAVLVNRYDGIDLPDDACRLLVIDGLPPLNNEKDKYIQSIDSSCSILKHQQIQRIEQGMGRGVRSNNDYCCIVLMGDNLADVLIRQKGIDVFSNATREQYNLSKELWDLLIEETPKPTIDDVFSLADFSLKHNDEWIKKSKERLSSIRYSNTPQLDSNTVALRSAYDYSMISQWDKSVGEINHAINIEEHNTTKGFLMQVKSKYINRIDKSQAQQTLLSAKSMNMSVISPLQGVRYEKRINNTRQPKVIIDYISNLGINKNEFLIYVDSKLSALDFSLDSDSFENALKEIGIILGFDSTRPDKETKGEGPDNLWAIGNNQYLVIECKNEATSETVSKTYCNQLAGSIRWFSSEYGDNFTATPILVHKSFILDRQASPVEKMRIITQEKLADFKRKIKDFVNALVQDTNWQDEIRIQQLLNQYNLNSESIVNMYSVDYLKNKS